MTNPLSKLQMFKATRTIPKSKVLRLHREDEALSRDILIAVRYAAMQRQADAHNVARGVYTAAPRASPAVH
jgi:hypothetical protein